MAGDIFAELDAAILRYRPTPSRRRHAQLAPTAQRLARALIWEARTGPAAARRPTRWKPNWGAFAAALLAGRASSHEGRKRHDRDSADRLEPSASGACVRRNRQRNGRPFLDLFAEEQARWRTIMGQRDGRGHIGASPPSSTSSSRLCSAFSRRRSRRTRTAYRRRRHGRGGGPRR